jgi:uncharacterized Zn finger protein (UPF0148 family)
MNVLQCTPCGSQLWTLTAAGTVICAKCGRLPTSLHIVFTYAQPELHEVERQPAKDHTP